MKKKLLFSFLSIILVFTIGFITLNQHQNTQNPDMVQESLKIDLLTANVEDLIKIPGIGPSKASAIIKHRENYGFNKIEDLKNVSGIGEKTFSNIKDYIYVSKNSYTVKTDKININIASLEELESLPGIGKVSSQKIVEYRSVKNIESIDELKKIGIPHSTIEKIEGMITF